MTMKVSTVSVNHACSCEISPCRSSQIAARPRGSVRRLPKYFMFALLTCLRIHWMTGLSSVWSADFIFIFTKNVRTGSKMITVIVATKAAIAGITRRGWLTIQSLIMVNLILRS